MQVPVERRTTRRASRFWLEFLVLACLTVSVLAGVYLTLGLTAAAILITLALALPLVVAIG